MRIAFVNSLYPPHVGGGAEVILRQLAIGLASRSCDVTVLCTHGERDMVEETLEGVRVIRLASRNLYWLHSHGAQASWKKALWHSVDSFNPAIGLSVYNQIKRLRPDVVVCHNLAGLSISVWAAAAACRTPVVQVLHDYYAICPGSSMYDGDRVCPTQCAKCHLFRLPHASASRVVGTVLGVSRSILDSHLRAGLFPNSKGEVVYNARGFTPAPASRSSEFMTFGFIGSLSKVKGIAELIEAFAIFAKSAPRSVRLLVAGKGEPSFIAELQKRATDSPIEFLGHTNPEQFFARIDVAVVPSVWQEPLGTVVVEALASGIPVIGSSRGGTSEMVEHGHNGFLYEPSLPGALLAALNEAARDPRRLHDMGVRARVTAKPFLDVDRMLDQHMAIYRRAVGLYSPDPGMAQSASHAD